MSRFNAPRRRDSLAQTLEIAPSRVAICEYSTAQTVFFREVNGRREFPLTVGLFEATTIDRACRRVPSPRPLTHELVAQAVEALGGSFVDVLIDRLEGRVFFAKIRINQNGKIVLLDARPSDAVAIALSRRPPLKILISRSVFERAVEFPTPIPSRFR